SFRAMGLYYQGDLPALLEVGRQLERMCRELGDRTFLGWSLLFQVHALGGRFPGATLAAELTGATPYPRAPQEIPLECLVLQAEGMRLLGTGAPEQAVE